MFQVDLKVAFSRREKSKLAQGGAKRNPGEFESENRASRRAARIHPQTYRGSYSTRCFLRKAINSA